ncbi:MAG: LysM peptidoglycan-binding domain-containing protein [bacterium]
MTRRNVVAMGKCMALAVLALAVAGCGRHTRQADLSDLDDVGLRDAKALEDRGDLAGAQAAYREVLRRDGGLARAHLALAFLLDRPHGDYVAAVYHYDRYLELRPNTEKGAMIRQRALAARLVFAGLTGRDASNFVWRAAALETQMRRVEADNAALRARVAELEHSPVTTGTVASMTTAIKNIPAPPKPILRKVTVGAGDTLRKIADRCYGDPNLWSIIYEANRENLRNPGDLELGQTLIVPRRR